MAIASSLGAAAVETVTVTEAGQLAGAITEELKYTVAELKVSGPINGEDIGFLREMAGVALDDYDTPTEGVLVSLDLSDATIVAGGKYLTKKYEVGTAKDNTIGENDSLSAIVAAAIGADLLILLSDIDGLYDSDPHRNPDARLIETVPVIDAHILSLAGDKGSALATGGMVTKLHAAQIATAAGCEMVIANGEKPEVLYDIVAGRRAGTRFLIPHS